MTIWKKNNLIDRVRNETRQLINSKIYIEVDIRVWYQIRSSKIQIDRQIWTVLEPTWNQVCKSVIDDN